MEQKHTIVIVVFILLTLGSLAILGLSWNGNEPKETLSDGDVLNNGTNHAPGTVATDSGNTPHDIGFPTTKDPSDFVPPEGWVKYTLDITNKNRFIRHKVREFFDNGSPIKGFEFWYPREFGDPETKNAWYDEDPVPEVTLSFYAPYEERHGNTTILIQVRRIVDEKNYLETFSTPPNNNNSKMEIEGRKVTGHQSERGYSFYFEVGEHLYRVMAVTDKDLIKKVGYTGTWPETYKEVFKSFRFVEK